MKLRYEGMKATSKNLIVYMRADYGNAVRFVNVAIPIAQIDAGCLAETADQKVRMDLLAIWSQERDEAPLF